MIFSIDQNCHSLWDVLPKLQALARRGSSVRHFVEDIDVAFTAMGADAAAPPSAPGGELRLALERFHRSGGADWGAALFYSEFLGRVPLEVRELEPAVGMKTKALARQLDRSVDELYDEMSPGDNWQLIAPSYVGGEDYHRVIGDLSVSETADFLRQIMQKARADMLTRFPAAESRRRIDDWFAREQRLLEGLLTRHRAGRLVELYRDWLAAYLASSPQVQLGFASELFTCTASGRTAVLEAFTRDYEKASALYNEALAETGSTLRPLRTADGELPFFAMLERQGHLARAGVCLRGDEIRIASPDVAGFKLGPSGRLPLAELAAAGVRTLAGKAILLTIQVRAGADGAALALPFGGSAYMPTSRRLAEKLIAAKLLAGKLHPVVRVRFRLLDRMKSLETPIRLPEHLAACLGAEEVPARRLGEEHAALAAEASRRLEAFGDAAAREQWQRRTFPQVFQQIEELEAARRQLAPEDPKGPRIRQVGRQIRTLEQTLLRETLRCAWRDWQVSRIDYYDSRGAVLPWCVALGGEEFYNQVLAQAEVYEEP